MNEEQPTERDVAELIDEIGRYLAAVDAFRAEGVDPTWVDNEATSF